jgi:hypothetical protein
MFIKTMITISMLTRTVTAEDVMKLTKAAAMELPNVKFY